jgi:hypothetical protein
VTSPVWLDVDEGLGVDRTFFDDVLDPTSEARIYVRAMGHVSIHHFWSLHKTFVTFLTLYLIPT